MKKYIPYALLGAAVGFSITAFFGFTIANWQWWALVVPLNLVGYVLLDMYGY